MAGRPRKKEAEEDKKSFEQSLSRLEEIVKKMENEEVPLEQLVELYKEGVELSVYCGSALKEAEQKVSVLKKTADGIFEKNSFDEEE